MDLPFPLPPSIAEPSRDQVYRESDSLLRDPGGENVFTGFGGAGTGQHNASFLGGSSSPSLNTSSLPMGGGLDDSSFLNASFTAVGAPGAGGMPPPHIPRHMRRHSSGTSGTSSTTRRSFGGMYSDRFIPSRSVSNFDAAIRSEFVGGGGGPDTSTMTTGGTSGGAGGGASDTPNSSPNQRSGSALFSMILRSELLGDVTALSAGDLTSPGSSPTRPSPGGAQPPNRTGAGHPPPQQAPITPGGGATAAGGAAGGALGGAIAAAAPAPPPPVGTPSILRFRRHFDPTSLGGPPDDTASPLSPFRNSLPFLSSSPGGTPLTSRRKIPKHPFKVLDAPGLADDFYLNVVDWSVKNVVGVGLGSSVYLWSAHTSRAMKLDELSTDQAAVSDEVACVQFTESGSSVAVGTRQGRVLLYDVEKCALLRTFDDAHAQRVGCASWNGPVLATGSRDRKVRERDTRMPPGSALLRDLNVHRQEVCGLRYSFEGLTGPHRQLASGGNDNRLLIWDARRTDQPIFRFAEHTAAVKALAWSPHQTGILASGGGTADRCIKVWSTLTGTCLSSLDTGSQVCGLVFSKTLPELVSTHGYSLNHLNVWRCGGGGAGAGVGVGGHALHKLATLQGHAMRVLYLSLSPDGSTIVTGAGDESLRFWSVWPGRASSVTTTSLVGVPGPGSLR